MALLLLACVVVIVDRLTKALVAKRLANGQSIRLGSWLRIRCVVHRMDGNRAFGERFLPLALVGGALAIVLFVADQGYLFQRPAAQVGLGTAIGGAISNGYDRLRRGAVIDFLDLGWWPVFNVADAAITVGVIAALLFMRS